MRELANVEALEGDWGQVGVMFELTEIGGFIVKDDLTRGRSMRGDPVREFLLGDARLAATELLTTPQTAAIVAVRLR